MIFFDLEKPPCWTGKGGARRSLIQRSFERAFVDFRPSIGGAVRSVLVIGGPNYVL